ncbi:hypothetical protein KC851_02505 [Candidatus Kaiserbacteria bacterium]|nr:hypothetical protein [Candidatus Kaiserbacteria bacterium]
MRKNIIIVIVVAAVLIGFGYFAVFSTPATDNLENINEAQDELSKTGEAVEAPQPVAGAGTFASLLNIGQNLECTVKVKIDQESEVTQVDGTAFVSQDRIRSDYVINSSEMGQIVSSMIVNGGVLYVWSDIDGQTFGTKMNVSDTDVSVEQFDKSHESLDQEVDYDCQPWLNVDNTVFEPPQDILFRDVNEIFEAGMEYGTIYEEDMELPF